MSALHWEARRRQTVLDNKLEMQRRLEETQGKQDVYDRERIAKVAEDLSRDPATPTASMLNRSRARLLKSDRELRDQECRRIVANDSRQMAKEMKYSAKLKNRYTSTNYVQQY